MNPWTQYVNAEGINKRESNMAKKRGRKCKVCKSRLKDSIERLIYENKLSLQSMSDWARNQGGDLSRTNIHQHKQRHMDLTSAKIPGVITSHRGKSTEKVELNLNYHAMLRDIISKLYAKVDVKQLGEEDMLKILHLLARLTDLISKVEMRKIEGSAVVSKLLEARAEGKFAGWIEGEEVEPEKLEEGGIAEL